MPISFFAHPDPIVPWSYALYILVAFISGGACGAVGIGGVFLTPVLILIHVQPKIGVAAVLTAFFPWGIFQVFAIRHRLHRQGSFLLSLGALPGAIAGALLLPFIPPSVITLVVSFVALFSGLNTLRQKRHVLCQRKKEQTDDVEEEAEEEKEDEKKDEQDEKHAKDEKDENVHIIFPKYFSTKKEKGLMICIGLFGGFMSILTASGGPFAILPVLFTAFPRIPAQEALFMVFAAGILICGACAIVSMITSEVDLGLSVCTFIALSIGMPIGNKIGNRVSKDWLKLVIAGLLVVLGAYALIQFSIRSSSSSSSSNNVTKSD